jgi:hypothetical protein
MTTFGPDTHVNSRSCCGSWSGLVARRFEAEHELDARQAGQVGFAVIQRRALV